jgi:hypothetical protein
VDLQPRRPRPPPRPNRNARATTQARRVTTELADACIRGRRRTCRRSSQSPAGEAATGVMAPFSQAATEQAQGRRTARESAATVTTLPHLFEPGIRVLTPFTSALTQNRGIDCDNISRLLQSRYGVPSAKINAIV